MSTPVPRVEGLTRDDFIRDWLLPQRPVIVVGALKDWPALTRWNPDYLRQAEEKLRVWVQFVDDRIFQFESGQMRFLRFPHYIDVLTTKAKPGEHAYLQAFDLADTQTLKNDVSTPSLIPDGQLAQTQMWLGGGATIPLHFDNYNTLLTQALGKKRVRLYPPGVAGYYPKNILTRSWQTSHVDAERPDLSTYPAFPHDQEQVADFQAGETLFIPLFWWHHVVHEGLTASISFGFRDGFAKQLAMTQTGRRVVKRMLLEPVAHARGLLEDRRRRKAALARGQATP
jgi:ribosomal protein L16 Arg81 hydroxylase